MIQQRVIQAQSQVLRAAAGDLQVASKDLMLAGRFPGLKVATHRPVISPLAGATKEPAVPMQMTSDACASDLALWRVELRSMAAAGADREAVVVSAAMLNRACSTDGASLEVEVRELLLKQGVLLRVLCRPTSVACLRRFAWLRLVADPSAKRADTPPEDFASTFYVAIATCPYLGVSPCPEFPDLAAGDSVRMAQAEARFSKKHNVSGRLRLGALDESTDALWEMSASAAAFAAAQPEAAKAFESHDAAVVDRCMSQVAAEAAATGASLGAEEINRVQWDPENSEVAFSASPMLLAITAGDTPLFLAALQSLARLFGVGSQASFEHFALSPAVEAIAASFRAHNNAVQAVRVREGIDFSRRGMYPMLVSDSFVRTANRAPGPLTATDIETAALHYHSRGPPASAGFVILAVLREGAEGVVAAPDVADTYGVRRATTLSRDTLIVLHVEFKDWTASDPYACGGGVVTISGSRGLAARVLMTAAALGRARDVRESWKAHPSVRRLLLRLTDKAPSEKLSCGTALKATQQVCRPVPQHLSSAEREARVPVIFIGGLADKLGWTLRFGNNASALLRRYLRTIAVCSPHLVVEVKLKAMDSESKERARVALSEHVAAWDNANRVVVDAGDEVFAIRIGDALETDIEEEAAGDSNESAL